VFSPSNSFHYRTLPKTWCESLASDWVSHTRSVSQSRRLLVSVTEWLMRDDWQWLLSDTHTDWVNWYSYWVIVCELQLPSYALIMRFNTHTTNNHAVIHFTCFWWSGIVSSSSWPKLSRLCTSRFCTPSFCLDLVSEPKCFSLCSELIKRRAVKLPHRIMVSIDSIQGVIVTYLSLHHCPCHVVVKMPLQLASVFSM